MNTKATKAAAKPTAPAGAIEGEHIPALTATDNDFVERWNGVLSASKAATALAIVDHAVKWAEAKNDWDALCAADETLHAKGGGWGELCREQGYQSAKPVAKLVYIGRARIDGPLTGVPADKLPASVSTLELLARKALPVTEKVEARDEKGQPLMDASGKPVVAERQVKSSTDVISEMIESGAINEETSRADVEKAIKRVRGEEVEAKDSSRGARTPSSGTAKAGKGEGSDARKAAWAAAQELTDRELVPFIVEFMLSRNVKLDAVTKAYEKAQPKN